MNENDLDSIKSTMATPGWFLIEEMFKNETIDARTAKYIDPDKDVMELGQRAKALGQAAKMVDKVLKKLKLMTSQPKIKKDIYS